MKMKSVRLSKDVVPIEYDIELRPDLENFTFSGKETIYSSILQKTRIITLHSKEIEIDTAHVLIDSDPRHGGARKVFAKISYNQKNETASFLFPEDLPVGKIKLTLVFRGILNNKMRGFYRSRYVVDEKEFYLATTQFEATDARRAFPAFDEPAHKAVFNVSLVVPKGKTAISNTLPVSVKEHEAGFDVVKFSPTPKMSTYLLAFIVGDFENLEGKTKRGVKVRVFTTPGKKHQAKFALECAIKTLEFYEKYFAINYPLPVLDMIAIPDFSSGAMENWGAVTYRESAILVDEENSSLVNKQWVALVIAHELAHQWFGNLVTMEWWTHLWLNEGFASYIEYLAVDKLFPSWDIWTQFSTNDLGVALKLDSLSSTHPIEVEVHHPDDIGEIFDEVSYSKGASIIRMLAEYIGEENFRDGLRYYLKKHSYKNTETIHLWQAFEKVSKQNVSEMMRNWTSKPGYPVIRAEIVNEELSLSQERFFASPIAKKKEKNNSTKWQVPISVFGDGYTKVNFGEAGFYRTAYSGELLEKLIIPVSNKVLSARDRLGIIRDLFALSEAGTVPTTDALSFLQAFKKEDNYSVLLEIAMGLSRIEQLLAKTPLKEKINEINLNIFSPLAQKLGWNKKDGELHTDTLLRSLALSRAGRAGDQKVILEAKKKFALIQKGGKVSADIKGVVYSIVAQNGGEKEYKILIEKYKKETLHEEKNRIGASLGEFRDIKILKNVCVFALSNDVRFQDAVGILSGVGGNPLGRDIWWSFVAKNWKTLVSRYGEGGLNLGRSVKAIGGSAEEKHLKSINKFFAQNEAPGAKRAIDQVIERLEGNIAWLKRDYAKLDHFFRKVV